MNYIKITAGIAASIILLWLAGALFCNSPYILVPHADLKTMGYPEGSRLIWRSEGFGGSRFGKWGVAAISNICNRNEGKVVLWGDSFVEALQVDDDKKMAQQVSRLLVEKGQTNLLAVGAGLSGQSCADYLLKISVYEKQMSPVAAHVVVIGQIEDLFPDQPTALFARFVSKPDLHIVPTELYNPSRLKWQAYCWGSQSHANGLLSVLRSCSSGADLRFKMGPIKKVVQKEQNQKSAADLEVWFGFYAREFKLVTDKPLILVYVPTTPRLEGNRWILSDEDDDAARCMERIFRQQGWTVINMKDRFDVYFAGTGSVPRGFSNTQPGAGHLNEAGHRLVAEAVSDALADIVLPVNSR